MTTPTIADRGPDRGPFRQYTDAFVQRLPRYVVKQRGGTWTTKQKPLADRPVEAHLRGQYAVGVVGKWYPEFSILDIDDRPRGDVDRIREALGLTESNSMLFTSESANSYHLFVRPEYHEKPPNLWRLRDSFADFAHAHGLEVYPQAGHAVRLPFGPAQTPLDLEYRNIGSWQDALFWFQKLDPFDISTVRGQQFAFDFTLPQRPAVPTGILAEADDLLRNGLQSPASRHESQFKVIYSLWRRNVPQDTAEDMTFGWIRRHHNGFSRDILAHPGDVRKEIARQAAHVYEKYQLGQVYPDTTHNLFHGFISREDVELIIQIARGSLTRMRFLFQLVKFFYPRRHRPFVGVHRDKLVEWSNERTYQRYLRELESVALVKRGSSYQTGRFSKSISLDWPFVASAFVLFDGRAVETFEDTVKLTLKPQDLRQLLEQGGAKSDTAYRMVKRIWDGSPA